MSGTIHVADAVVRGESAEALASIGVADKQIKMRVHPISGTVEGSGAKP